jgi:hypothetical protein
MGGSLESPHRLSPDNVEVTPDGKDGTQCAAGTSQSLPDERTGGCGWRRSITNHATWLAGDERPHPGHPVPRPHRRLARPEPRTNKNAAQRLNTGIAYEPLQVRAVSTAVNKTGRGASKDLNQSNPSPTNPYS